VVNISILVLRKLKQINLSTGTKIGSGFDNNHSSSTGSYKYNIAETCIRIFKYDNYK
jgi:hypothetical protein